MTDPTPQPRLRAVIVDDLDENRRMLEFMLIARGHQVVAKAAGGHEALAAIAQTDPDVVISDFAMPGMNGLELVQHLRATATTRTLPVLIATASDEADIAVLRAMPWVGVIAKPVSVSALVDELHRLVSRRRDTEPAMELIGRASGRSRH